MPKKGSKLYSILHLRCPKCHEGHLFTHSNPYSWKYIGEMPEQCPVCGQPFTLEPGFYFGAAYVSYALNVAWLIVSFLIAEFVLDLDQLYFFILAGIAMLVLAPWIFRFSRAIWINFFVKYDPTAARLED
ncbi:MAG: DUF983 domain-containing protein [Bacteroidetes bacterium]|nr:MAG: DUF983 domain-containing protein [Bacteroidota bacterium]